MRKSLKIAVVILLMAVVAIFFAGCSNESKTPYLHGETKEIQQAVQVELPEKTVVFIDTSASIDEDTAEAFKVKAEEIKADERAVVLTFADEPAVGGQPAGVYTSLIAPLTVSQQYDRIYVLTDCWNQTEGGQSLSFKHRDFSYKEIIFVTPKKTEHSEELAKALSEAPESFQNSSVRIEFMDCTKNVVIYDDYIPPTAEVVYTDTDTQYELRWDGSVDKKPMGGLIWWWPIVVGGALLLLALLGFLLWRHKRAGIAAIKRSNALLLDFSGSMSSFSKTCVKQARKTKGKIFYFSEEVHETTVREVESLAARGKTNLFAALNYLREQGFEKLVVVTDGQASDDATALKGHFKSITLVCPKRLTNEVVIDHLRKKADRVRVLYK